MNMKTRKILIENEMNNFTSIWETIYYSYLLFKILSYSNITDQIYVSASSSMQILNCSVIT
jgi:hypothetical protein